MRYSNLSINGVDSADAARLYDEYKSLGFHVSREGNEVTVFALPPTKPKKKKKQDEKQPYEEDD